MAFSYCFFLAAMAIATAPAIPTSHVLFRRIQREGSMLKGLLTAGLFVPVAGPSQAAAVTRCAPKAAHCPKLSLSLPSLHWRTHPCCAGVTASIALVSLPSTRWRHHPSFAHHLCLASSITTWHLPSHETVTTHTGVIASTMPLLLPV